MAQETTGPTLPPMGGTSGTSVGEDIYGEDSEETSAPPGGRHAIGRFWDDLAGFDVAHPGRSLYDDEDVKEIRRWNEAQATLIQEQLIAAGLLDPDNVQFFGKGKDPATIKAWEKLLGEANVAESTWEDLLKIRVDNETARIQLDQRVQARPLRISLTNPEELKDAFNATAWDMLGTKLTEEQLTSMTSAWHDRERSEQAEAYSQETAAATQAAESGEDVTFETTEPASPDTQVKHAIYDIDPSGAEAMGYAKAHQQWLGLLGGPTGIGRQRGGNRMASETG